MSALQKSRAWFVIKQKWQEELSFNRKDQDQQDQAQGTIPLIADQVNYIRYM